MVITNQNEGCFRGEFLEILYQKKLTTVYQPIVSLEDGSIYGYEALTRGPEGSALYSPEILFQCAQRFNKLWELEFLCRSMALQGALQIKTAFRLFINVNPNIMQDVEFRKGFTCETLKKYNIDPERIIFEITESEAIYHPADFIRTINHYKDQHYGIAIDDAGAGYSGLNLISDIHPNYIKLDMKLIRNIDQDKIKQSLVACLNDFANVTGTSLIAEGIETPAELSKLIDIGVQYGQGYFIGRPNGIAKPISPDVIKLILKKNREKDRGNDNPAVNNRIASICKAESTISPELLVSEVHHNFKENEKIPGFCIVEDERPIGVITRNALYKKISGQYGYIVYANKPVRTIMDTQFMISDALETIDIVGKNAMKRDFDKIYDFIVVTHQQKYSGVVTVKDLMEKLIEIEFFYAKHLNPLSELPGNLMIEMELEKTLKSKEKHIILYFDLDNFKAYNDLYGFENGDRVLKEFARVLKTEIPADHFIGHIGGDDFIAIIPKKKTDSICTKIIRAFDESVVTFYTSEDLRRGFILSKNRNDIEESFPILSVSIAGIYSGHHKTVYELAERAAKIKKKCKKRSGSCYLLE